MSLTPYPIPVFGGLNLVDDPEEVGATQAIDLLNVDLDKQGKGRIRSRDGYLQFTAVASTHEFDTISPHYEIGGTKQILAGLRDNGTQAYYGAYSSAGVVVNLQAFATTDVVDTDFCRFGGPSAEVTYIVSWESTARTTTNDSYRWDGGFFNTAELRLGGTGNFWPFALEIKAGENRLVAAYPTANNSRIGFSDPGAPETFGGLNYVDLTPGDGERITALCSWRELVFAFKESKFFVFGQTTTSTTGTPVFNYRPVYSGVGTIGRACAVSSPAGVYFLSRRGIYLTNGNDPVLVSRAIDPIFQGGLVSPFSSYGLNYAAIDRCALHWHAERLYFSYPSGTSTVNNRVLVFDPKNNYWTIWDMPANKFCTFRPDDAEELMFGVATGLNPPNHIHRHSSAYDDDDGTAIASHYQSGFYEINPGMKTTTRWTELWGSGALTYEMFTDHSSTDPLTRSESITLGTAPQVIRAYHNKSYMGDLFSHKFSSDGATWSLNRIEHQSQFGSQPQ